MAARVHPSHRSDGPQPHLVNIQFHKKTRVKEIEIYTEYTKDESYTPANISVRAGTTFHDIQEVHSMELEEPNGWVTVPLAPPGAEVRPGEPRGYIRTYFIQLAILSCHQNGRDTHIRQIRVYSPAE
jgi:anaphase-promoting complex subunit 10